MIYNVFANITGVTSKANIIVIELGGIPYTFETTPSCFFQCDEKNILSSSFTVTQIDCATETDDDGCEQIALRILFSNHFSFYIPVVNPFLVKATVTFVDVDEDEESFEEFYARNRKMLAKQTIKPEKLTDKQLTRIERPQRVYVVTEYDPETERWLGKWTYDNRLKGRLVVDTTLSLGEISQNIKEWFCGKTTPKSTHVPSGQYVPEEHTDFENLVKSNKIDFMKRVGEADGVCRKQVLEFLLNLAGLEYRQDSRVCELYIQGGVRAIHRNLQDLDKIQSVIDVVFLMEEMHFLHTKTDYVNILDDVYKRFWTGYEQAFSHKKLRDEAKRLTMKKYLASNPVSKIPHFLYRYTTE